MEDNENKVTHIPRNFFVKSELNIPEKHEYEQFFWTQNVLDKLLEACEYNFVEETCCLTTPSLANAFHDNEREEVLLDIDERFDFLPKYHYYDVKNPQNLDQEFKLLILDPPFFVVPIEQFRVAVDVLTNKNYDTKIIIGFIKREERRLLNAFRDYNIKLTSFKLEYASIKPNKWNNFALYSNVDLPNIKRIL